MVESASLKLSLVAFACLASTATAGPSYRVTDLRSPGADSFANAVGIDDSGIAYGVAHSLSVINPKPVRWDLKGVATFLTLPVEHTTGILVNAAGDGTAFGISGSKPTIWRANGVATLEGSGVVFGGSGATFVGESRTAEIRVPTVWRDGVVETFPAAPDGGPGLFKAVNADGIAVGNYGGQLFGDAAIILQDGTLQIVQPAAGYDGIAFNDINDSATIVGIQKFLNQNRSEGMVRNGSRQVVLGSIPGYSQFVVPMSINPSGEIVGRASDRGQTGTGMIWSGTEHRPWNINDLIDEPDVWISGLNDINAKGQIVGYGTRSGIATNFVLTPVTAIPLPPAALSTLTLVPAFLGWARLRKRAAKRGD